MKVLLVTGMYPTPGDPVFGRFVAEQVESLCRQDRRLEVDLCFFDGRRSRLNYLKAVPEIRRRLMRGGHDLVHAHYGLAGLVAAAALGLPGRWPGSPRGAPPMVVTLHGSDMNVGWQRLATRPALARAGAAIAVSRPVARLAQRAARCPVEVIPCGVDLARFRPMPPEEARARLGWSPRAQYLLFPSDPRRRVKRHHLFRRVVALVRRAGWSVIEVDLAGIEPERVPLILNACDALVMTSRSEGSPCIVKEALACNLPVVSVDVGDVAEYAGAARGCFVAEWREDECGLAAELAGAVAAILERGARAEGLARVEHLSQDQVARRILGVYQRAGSVGRAASA